MEAAEHFIYFTILGGVANCTDGSIIEALHVHGTMFHAIVQHSYRVVALAPKSNDLLSYSNYCTKNPHTEYEY